MIRLFLVDVDGTLTDGTYWVMPDGKKIKRFHTRDFVGLNLLNKSGCKVGIITGDWCVSTYKQIKRAAPFALYYEHVKDKERVASDLIQELGLEWDSVAFIGDDTNDYDLLKKVGFPFCPANAVQSIEELVKSRNGVISSLKGGEGCVRDVAEDVMMYNEVRITTK